MSPDSGCMSHSNSSENAPRDDSSRDRHCSSQSRTTPLTAEPSTHVSTESTENSRQTLPPQASVAAIEHEVPVKCQYCPRLFAPQSLRRHLVSRHSFACEKGCAHQAFETRRDLDRHYKTLMHQAPVDSGSVASSSAADYECACGKRDFRKDLHKRHLRTCKKTGRGTFHCRRCDHHVTDKALHEAHLATCLRQRGRGRKTNDDDGKAINHQ